MARGDTITLGWYDRRDETEHPYTLTVRVTPGTPDRGPDFECAGGYPGDPDEVEVLKVVDDETGEERPDLIDEAQETVDCAEALEAYEDSRSAAQEDYWDSLREARNDELCSTLRDIAGRR